MVVPPSATSTWIVAFQRRSTARSPPSGHPRYTTSVHRRTDTVVPPTVTYHDLPVGGDGYHLPTPGGIHGLAHRWHTTFGPCYVCHRRARRWHTWRGPTVAFVECADGGIRSSARRWHSWRVPTVVYVARPDDGVPPAGQPMNATGGWQVVSDTTHRWIMVGYRRWHDGVSPTVDRGCVPRVARRW